MKNKILAISIIFILISFTFITSCYAATYDLTTVSYISENNYNWAIYKSNDENYYLIVCIENGYQTLTLYNNHLFASKSGGLAQKGQSKIYLLNSDGTITLATEYNEINMTQYPVVTVLYSSKDIHINNAGSSSGIFFQQTPVDNTQLVLGKVTLAEIMKTAGEQANLEVYQIILTVIATTAGLMVLLVGLKKGLTVLMNGFRH